MWTSRNTDEPATVWAAVPPTREYIALGMVATAGSAATQPPFDAMRCVPKAWTTRCAGPAERLWSGDEGTVWRGAHGLIVAAKPRKQAPPTYELIKTGELRFGA